MFNINPLPYGFDALEPVIDAQTMQLHHDKHHQAYTDNLNKAVEANPDLQGKTIEELLNNINSYSDEVQKALRNHGGGYYNHMLFWELMAPAKDSSDPSAELMEAIDADLGGLDAFKEEFISQSTKLFGSGWVWLATDENGQNLHIHQHPNQENPLMHNHKALLGLDVWEHAYYLKYQNRRAEYIEAWWQIINWNKVSELLVSARA